jgi:hypothetical protein
MISLHVYSPPLLNMSNYQEEQRENELLTVMYEIEP